MAKPKVPKPVYLLSDFWIRLVVILLSVFLALCFAGSHTVIGYIVATPLVGLALRLAWGTLDQTIKLTKYRRKCIKENK